MLERLALMLLNIFADKLGAWLLSLYKQQQKDSAIDKATQDEARTVNIITSDIYALEDELEAHPDRKEEIELKLKGLRDELRIATRRQSMD